MPIMFLFIKFKKIQISDALNKLQSGVLFNVQVTICKI